MPAAGPSSASPRPSVDIAVFDEHDMDTFPHPAEKGTLRAFSSSALELPETYAASSLELPHTLTSERIRRRSELSRFRPLDSPPAVEPESIELPVIQEYSESGGKKQLDFRETAIPSRDNDVEIAPSFPSSLAPSIRLDEDTDSTAPAISAAQKAVYRRKHAIHFATLCFTIFLNGWNDGTTGPLLPRIQSYYHVSWRRHSACKFAGC